MAKKIIKSEIRFPRSWEQEFEGAILNAVTQPYISGLYLCVTSCGKIVAQGEIKYNKVRGIIKKLESDEKVKNLNLGRIGDFLNPEELEYIK